jgi:cytochrome P450
MSVVQDKPSTHAPGADPARCPVDHHVAAEKKSVRPRSEGTAPVEQDSRGVWHVRGFEEVRTVLRSSETQQAGFKAELVATGKALTNRPILYQEGKIHQEQRTKTARFFTPKTVSTQYRQMMERLADRLVAQARRQPQIDLTRMSLTMAVAVAGQVVGLTNSRRRGMGRRLEAFFEQTTVSRHHGALGRLIQMVNLRRLLWFYWFDVRPAIKARRARPQEDVISHLLAQNYSDPEILTECVTYGAAGMATTREFISMAAWHLLDHPDLRARYLAAPEAERVAILHEMLRLEPVVGHLYRRATDDIPLRSNGAEVVIPKGALIDLHIESANLDERVVGEAPTALCPMRPLRGDRVGAMLMSFGDGAHRCPGAYLAIQETDIFLQRLLAIPNLCIVRPPALIWNELTAGYELRRFLLGHDTSRAA